MEVHPRSSCTIYPPVPYRCSSLGVGEESTPALPGGALSTKIRPLGVTGKASAKPGGNQLSNLCAVVRAVPRREKLVFSKQMVAHQTLFCGLQNTSAEIRFIPGRLLLCCSLALPLLYSVALPLYRSFAPPFCRSMALSLWKCSAPHRTAAGTGERKEKSVKDEA